MGQPQVALRLAAGILDSPLQIVLGGHAAASSEGAARLAFWREATGGMAAPTPALEARLAADLMALYGHVPPQRLRARRGPMLDRAAAALRAVAHPQPQGLRRAARSDDVTRHTTDTAFAGFFAVEVLDLAFRRFDGATSPPLRREVFVGCDAVTVLPFDPRRNRILLVEQLRIGSLARGEPNPWQIEAVAGRIDAGETPEEAARRECAEEAGLVPDRLERVAEYYPSPGAFTEYLYSFVGLCDLPDGVAGVHGVAAEAEDIRGHLLSWSEAQERLEAGEFGNAPLILTLNWLARHHDRLCATAARAAQI